MTGPTREELQRKQSDDRMMNEVWKKTQLVHNLKASLQSRLKMVVNEDKLDQALDTAKKQLLGL